MFRIGDEKKIKNIKVSFSPQFTPTDDYQKQLIRAIEKLGVKVRGIDVSTRFLPFGIRDQFPDIVHLHWLHSFFSATPKIMESPFLKFFGSIVSLIRSFTFILGLVVLKILGIKIVWTAHNINHHENLHPLADQACTAFVARFSDLVFVHCEAAKYEIYKKFNIQSFDKIVVIPHGNYVDFYENRISRSDARKKLKIPDEDLIFLFFGLIRPYKGIFKLIEAFQYLEQDHVQLIIAGKPLDDNLSERINQVISECGNIKYFPGFVPNDQIQVYMNACDIVALPYQNILTSGAAILVMSFGKACIAPRLGCIGEVLDDSGSFLYQSQDHKGLIQTLQEAVDNKKNLPFMGQYNRQKVDKWDWDYVAQITIDAYQKCLR